MDCKESPIAAVAVVAAVDAADIVRDIVVAVAVALHKPIA
jgi:hypothetical protein